MRTDKITAQNLLNSFPELPASVKEKLHTIFGEGLTPEEILDSHNISYEVKILAFAYAVLSAEEARYMVFRIIGSLPEKDALDELKKAIADAKTPAKDPTT